jgi:hypothetical protein
MRSICVLASMQKAKAPCTAMMQLDRSSGVGLDVKVLVRPRPLLAIILHLYACAQAAEQFVSQMAH